MREIYDIGIVFRGFIIVNEIFKDAIVNKDLRRGKDLRGAFISAISSFAQNVFSNNNLEYLESGKFVFIFKMAEIKSRDNKLKEPVILYALVEKKKKKIDKYVKNFLSKANSILKLFIQKYQDKDFTEINQFEPFKEELKNRFIKKQDISH